MIRIIQHNNYPYKKQNIVLYDVNHIKYNFDYSRPYDISFSRNGRIISLRLIMELTWYNMKKFLYPEHIITLILNNPKCSDLDFDPVKLTWKEVEMIISRRFTRLHISSFPI